MQEIATLPEITHLQALVLSILAQKDWQSARTLREQLAEYGIKNARPTFFLLMQRLENLVEGKPVNELRKGQNFPHTVYRITKEGRTALKNAATFYESLDVT